MENINIEKLGALAGQDRRLFESINNPNKKLAYTSFDGDDMLLIPNMEEDVIRHGNIPVNPESALGYYVSTKARNNQKKEVMKDCITLEMMCDCFDLYTNYNFHIPEGVLVELALWNKFKSSKSFRLIPSVSEYSGMFHFNRQRVTSMDKHEVISQANSFVRKFHQDLDNTFLKYDEIRQFVRNSNYIIFDRKHYKYSDWLRNYIYENKETPISPNHLLDFHIYEKIYATKYIDRILQDRLSLLNKVDKITIFNINKDNFYEEYALSDIFCKFDIFAAFTFFKSKIEFASLGQAGVPKYNGKWSLTSQERSEVMDTKISLKGA